MGVQAVTILCRETDKLKMLWECPCRRNYSGGKKNHCLVVVISFFREDQVRTSGPGCAFVPLLVIRETILLTLLYAMDWLPACSLGPSAFPSCKLPSESALSMLQQKGKNSTLVLSCGSVEVNIFLLTTFCTLWDSTFQLSCGSSVYSERSCPSSLAWSPKLCSGRLQDGVDLPLTSKVPLWCSVFPPASWRTDIFAYLWISGWLSLIPVKTVLMLSSSK